jgi:hypothetical protein
MTAALLVAMSFGLVACSHDTTPAGAQRSAGPTIVPIVPVDAASPSQDNPFALFLKTADGVLVANPDLTPGHATPGIAAATVCEPGYGLNDHRAHYGTRAAVLAAYGLAWSARDEYQFDDLIPASLGGDDTKANLWPMPLTGPATPAMKAALTTKLHDLVCANKLTVAAAQKAIATNWWAAYQQYGRPAPIPQATLKAICPSLGARAQSPKGEPLVCAVARNKWRWLAAPTTTPAAAVATPTAKASQTPPTAKASPSATR